MALETHPVTGIVFDSENPQNPGVDRFFYIEADDLATFDIDDESTYNVKHTNAYWGRNDGGPQNGLNPRFMYFRKLPTDTVGPFDHRYTKVTEQQLVLTDPAPDAGHPVGTYQKVESSQILSKDDLKLQVDSAFQQEIRARYPQIEDPATVILGGGATIRKAESATLSADQEAAVLRVKQLEDAVRQLDDMRLAKYAAIDAGENYDIEDWDIAE